MAYILVFTPSKSIRTTSLDRVAWLNYVHNTGLEIGRGRN